MGGQVLEQSLHARHEAASMPPGLGTGTDCGELVIAHIMAVQLVCTAAGITCLAKVARSRQIAAGRGHPTPAPVLQGCKGERNQQDWIVHEIQMHCSHTNLCDSTPGIERPSSHTGLECSRGEGRAMPQKDLGSHLKHQ